MFLPAIGQLREQRGLLIELNPCQTLVAGITRPRRGPVTLDFAAEFDRANTVALRQWLEGKADHRKTWQTAICGFVPQSGLLQRETVQPADLINPARLAEFIREQQTRRGGSSAPFHQASADGWVFRALGALDGQLLQEDGPARPALLLGLPRPELHEVQQHLLDLHLMPLRLEPALPPLFGSLYYLMARRHQPQAPVVFVIREQTTAVYILGKEGVHTPGVIPHGLSSIVQLVRKDLALEDDTEARRRLTDPSEELRKRIKRLLRGIGGELRPVIDSYEMTTGQPVGDIYCAYLPPSLAWLAEPLAQVVGHQPLALDCQEWMQTAGLQPAPRVPALGPQWLGALSLVARLPEASGLKSEKSFGQSISYQRPWHADCRQLAELPNRNPVRTRFLAATVAVALAVLGLTVAGWQWYVRRALRADTDYWQSQMDSNQALFDELTTAGRDLLDRTGRLERAHALMRAPFQTTEFLMTIGRSLPPRMRLDRIEANDQRVLLAGSLLEPAEEASRSLGRYLESLRRHPELAGRFASISATSLQRERATEALAFEITLRLNPPRP